MDNLNEEDMATITHQLEQNRLELLAAEATWHELRLRNRALALHLITTHGISVSKVAQLSGHTRQTLKIWLDVWNAEHKSAQKKN